MLDEELSTTVTPEADAAPAPARAPRKRAAKKVAASSQAPDPQGTDPQGTDDQVTNDQATDKHATDEPAPAKKPARKRAAKKVAEPAVEVSDEAPKKAKRKSTKKAVAQEAPAEAAPEVEEAEVEAAAVVAPTTMLLFQAPVAAPVTRTPRKKAAPAPVAPADEAAETDEPEVEDSEAETEGEDSETATRRRPRRRGGRRRRRPADGETEASEEGEESDSDDSETSESEGEETTEVGTRRRRRRSRRTPDENASPRSIDDEITAVNGSTRLEAKKQRRREGREAGRRRAPIVSEAEFLARREAVDRVMVVRQHDDLTQIAVLEDKVLVEHYVARESQTSMIGNVYIGRVQNVLPSMEAAFIDIGKGRNAVLYAGEVNWQSLGHTEGQPRKIEAVLQPGQPVLVQVTKDPVGHKGARLTSQISLPGRFLVYVPDGTTSGISRKLPDTERNRLKAVLRDIVPDTAGVIVRTAAEGASEEELTRDVERLTARWADIEAKVAAGRAPELLYGEPHLTLKVVRDLFTEDFASLIVQGDEAWDLVDGYVAHVAPDLRDRLRRFEPVEGGSSDVFASYRIDEQIAKGLDRKVWLPSGGSLVIDRTEAMTVVDVNTGKFTGSGGNLEETVTKNNLEAAEEIVRQLRLRDIGGIIVIDFIDMVLESNRDLVLRRLVECLGRDRTRHQVAEVTSLGLVQMTRKRIGTGLLEAFSHDCDQCNGRGVVVHGAPVEPTPQRDEPMRSRRGRGRTPARPAAPVVPTPRDLATAVRPEPTSVELDEPDELEEGQIDPESLTDEGDGFTEEFEPLDEESAEEAEPEVVAPPAPRVVTSTRRRGARRAAGPPVALEAETPAQGAPVEDSEAAPAQSEEDADGEGEEGAESTNGNVLHVPIKRKGTRKR